MFGIKRKPATPPPAEIAGVKVRVSKKARRLSLRIDIKMRDVVLTWPRGASEGAALKFIQKNHDWIIKSRQKIPQKQIFASGHKITINGIEYEIVHKEGRGVTAIEDDKLIVYGRPEHISRRIRDFLKTMAHDVLSAAARDKLTSLGLKMTEIRVIDPKTRWGSCAPDGRMMFSWRLLLTPPDVMDYIVAHEVAHRVHMNHGKKFWQLCYSLTKDADAERKWLRKHGNEVMAYE